MTRIDNDKLKLWTIIAQYYRFKYEDKVSIFFRSNPERHAAFCLKYIDSQPIY